SHSLFHRDAVTSASFRTLKHKISCRIRKVVLIQEPFVLGLVADAFEGGVQSAPGRPTRLPWL
ncbi:hypothetical protein ABY44_28960, partial [Burkholderia sp. ZZQ-2]|uniref:hypothetical protein n=1 Tax=Burkholderia sp. ZZQ-2 TaxID=1661766 RepID=UPI003D6F7834